jgi:hypothetical protein
MFVKALDADVAPVPPCDNPRGDERVNPANVGDAVVLKSCDVLIFSTFEEPYTVIPLLLENEMTPILGVAVPVVPTNVFDARVPVFALAKAAEAKVFVAAIFVLAVLAPFHAALAVKEAINANVFADVILVF